MNTYITAGEFAKLAGTTKRTIHFYDEKGVLKPVKTNKSNYRLYDERQILDYQMILMLSTFGLSLDEIKLYLKHKGDLSVLFGTKKTVIKNEIERLRFCLDNLEKYLSNLSQNGTMVNPEVKSIDPFEVYYIERIGPYSKIGRYCKELEEMFVSKGKDFTTLAIFEDQTYRPKQSQIKICAFMREGMVLKEEYKDNVKQMTFRPRQVLSYTYYGSGNMLSLFWKELEKYARLNGYKPRMDIPDFEIYWKVNDNPTKQKFEIFMPIDFI